MVFLPFRKLTSILRHLVYALLVVTEPPGDAVETTARQVVFSLRRFCGKLASSLSFSDFLARIQVIRRPCVARNTRCEGYRSLLSQLQIPVQQKIFFNRFRVLCRDDNIQVTFKSHNIHAQHLFRKSTYLDASSNSSTGRFRAPKKDRDRVAWRQVWRARVADFRQQTGRNVEQCTPRRFSPRFAAIARKRSLQKPFFRRRFSFLPFPASQAFCCVAPFLAGTWPFPADYLKYRVDVSSGARSCLNAQALECSSDESFYRLALIRDEKTWRAGTFRGSLRAVELERRGVALLHQQCRVELLVLSFPCEVIGSKPKRCTFRPQASSWSHCCDEPLRGAFAQSDFRLFTLELVRIARQSWFFPKRPSQPTAQLFVSMR